MCSSTKETLRVLWVEDDRRFADYWINVLKAKGCKVFWARNPRDALKVADKQRQLDSVILDIMMDHEVRRSIDEENMFEDDYTDNDDNDNDNALFSLTETRLGYRTGIALLKELRDLLPEAKFIALTNSEDPEVQEWFDVGRGYAYCNKRDYTPRTFANFVFFFTQDITPPMRSFIVHGHDQTSCLQLKNYLQNTIGLPEPIILAEKPSRGMTLIEKFEHYAEDADLVFALFTPDDFKDDLLGGRARQNVIFEFGFFMGALGRRSGRVFMLHKGTTEIPSDLKGIIYINISSGIEAAGEQIRLELRGLFHPNRTEQ